MGAGRTELVMQDHQSSQGDYKGIATPNMVSVVIKERFCSFSSYLISYPCFDDLCTALI